MSIPQELAFEIGEYRERLQATKAAMATRGLSTLLLFSPFSIYYLSGMDGETVYGTEALIVPMDGDPTLVLHAFERGRAANTAWVENVVTFSDQPLLIDGVVGALRELGLATGHIALEQRWVAPAAPPLGPQSYQQLAESLPGATLHDAYGLVDELRLRKSPAEVDYMREAAALTEVGMDAGFGAMGAGVSDRVVAASICDAIYRGGSDLMCWGPVVASGYRSGAPHSTFNGRQLEAGDTVLMEVTGQIRRYVGPALRTATIGPPSAEVERLAHAAEEGVATVIATSGPGVPASEVARAGLAAVDPILQGGYGFHGTFGYPIGIGYPPTWGDWRGFLTRPTNDRPLESGMTFHLAVALRKYGEFGVCQSQTMVVTDDGAVALTSFPAPMRTIV
jgi:Xaa-Pro dipeptidase